MPSRSAVRSVASVRAEATTWRAKPSRLMTRANDEPISPKPMNATRSNRNSVVIFESFDCNAGNPLPHSGEEA